MAALARKLGFEVTTGASSDTVAMHLELRQGA